MPELRKITADEAKNAIQKNIEFLTKIVQLQAAALEVLKPFINKPLSKRIATAYTTAHPDHQVYLAHEHGQWYLHVRFPGQSYNDGARLFLGYYPNDKNLTELRWNDLQHAAIINGNSIKKHEQSLMFLDTWVEKHNFAVGILSELKKTISEYGVQGSFPIGHIYIRGE
jgi:hypothetical protein